jgi:SAM-dependent methyltransferase
VLDFGCGRGSYINDLAFVLDLRILKGKVRKVIGVDVDPSAESNPFIDEFHLLESGSSAWPVSDASIDLILSDWVLEHIEEPDFFFSEARRVLKPGGKLCIRTSNKWSYVSTFARLIPERYHYWILSKIQPGRKCEDIFPTRYACNTPPTIRKKLRMSGFDGIVYGNVAQPSYLEFSCFIYGLGVLLHKMTPKTFAHTLYIFAEKP